MKANFGKAYVAGVECLAAWSELLDQINVFPVADGDTGRNLVISLAPLRQLHPDREELIHALLLSARGNSGNIASSFFSGFLTADSKNNLLEAVKKGQAQAWKAVNEPQAGTMLTVFDELVRFMEKHPLTSTEDWVRMVLSHLEDTVRRTPDLLPKLKEAGVVDAGALGMFIYFQGFFNTLFGCTDDSEPITQMFEDQLRISPSFQEELASGYCIDMVLHLQDGSEDEVKKLSEASESVVIIQDQDYYRIHLHTEDKEKVRKGFEAFGDMVRWSDDDLGAQIKRFSESSECEQAIHIMTDAAGSVTREDAKRLGITLLDSYITAGEKCLPETHFMPSEIYAAMRHGTKVVTSQASIFERHQYYQSVLQLYKKVLYLCVGSVYTGNYQVVTDWKTKNDPENRLVVIDSTAASGRLGTVVLATARFSRQASSPAEVIDFARQAINLCEEYVFLDTLKYLARGGRLSKTSAFFGDMLHMKPVISPTAEGAKKVGVVRNQADQLNFALKKIEKLFAQTSAALIMLEYSDNESWVSEVVKSEVMSRYPGTEILVRPLSLTSGVHMGPGTWALVLLPVFEKKF